MNGNGGGAIDVLLVDDEPDFARLAAEHLEAGVGNLAVTVETDPTAALQRLEAQAHDCVVSDFDMPDMNGLELLETVRGHYPDLPFLLFTGQGSETIASEAISAGVTEYMQKQTDPEQFAVLANRIRNAVERYRTAQELERAETRYRRLVEGNLTGIVILRRDGVVAYANPKCEEIFEYQAEGLDGVSVYDLVADDDHPTVEKILQTAESSHDEEFTTTLTGRRANGRSFKFQIHAGRIVHGGNPAVLGSLVDVTEQREREHRLEEYRELVENVGDPMYVLRADGTIDKANSAMAEMLGIAQESLVGRHAAEFVDDEDFARGNALVEDFVEGSREPPVTEEFIFLTADDDRIPCEANITPLFDKEGSFRGTVGVVRVITERKERERELREYETIVETAPDGVFIVDEDGYVISTNEPGAQLTGMERDELIGAHHEELVEAGIVEPSFPDRYRQTVDRLLNSESAERKAKMETTFTRSEGSRVVTEIHISPLLDDDGSFRGTVGVVRDISERKSFEEALRTERDRLSALFENIPEPTVEYQFQGGEPIVLGVNDAFEETFGYTEAEVTDESLDEYIVPDDAADEAATLNDRVINGEELDVELRRVTVSGERRDFLLRNAPIPTEDDSVQGYAIYTDVTERKEVRERVNALFENSTDCIVETEYIDGEPIVKRVNDAFVQTFGYAESELIGENLDEFILDDPTDPESREINQRVHSGERVEVEVTRMTDEGPRDFLLRAIPFDLYEGDWTYAVYTDITERKERERRLSALHDATRHLMEATGQPTVLDIGLEAAESVLGLSVAGFYELSEDGESLSPLNATEKAQRLFGRLPELGADESLAWEVLQSGDSFKTGDVREHSNVHDPETPIRSEMIIPVDDSRVFIAAAEAIDAFDEADEMLARVLVSNVGAALDRAEREMVLRERERRLSALHDATRQLMEATSRSEVCDIGLDAAERVVGLEAAAIYVPGDDETTLEPFAATAGAREVFDGMPTFDHTETDVWDVYENGGTVVTDDAWEEGTVIHQGTVVRSKMVLPLSDHGVFIAAAEEVGAFDEADQALAKVLASNVESALDRAERERLLREREKALLRQNERLEEFAGVVSHDLRSPLTVAKGNAYLLRERGGDEYLDKVESSLERMERLIDDLLTLAREGETVEQPEPVDLADVASDAWESVDTKEATLDVPSEITISADPGRLQQLLENLLANAVEHGGDDVTVTVDFDDHGLYIADDGEGLPDEDVDELFEAGFTTDEEGTGFGLSIVKQIAEAHGWGVAIGESAEGGARFTFTDVEMAEPRPAN